MYLLGLFYFLLQYKYSRNNQLQWRVVALTHSTYERDYVANRKQYNHKQVQVSKMQSLLKFRLYSNHSISTKSLHLVSSTCITNNNTPLMDTGLRHSEIMFNDSKRNENVVSPLYLCALWIGFKSILY